VRDRVNYPPEGVKRTALVCELHLIRPQRKSSFGRRSSFGSSGTSALLADDADPS
jgi:hypothetical protein